MIKPRTVHFSTRSLGSAGVNTGADDGGAVPHGALGVSLGGQLVSFTRRILMVYVYGRQVLPTIVDVNGVYYPLITRGSRL